MYSGILVLVACAVLASFALDKKSGVRDSLPAAIVFTLLVLLSGTMGVSFIVSDYTEQVLHEQKVQLVSEREYYKQELAILKARSRVDCQEVVLNYKNSLAEWSY